MSTSSGEGVLVRECYAVLAAGDEIDSDRLFVDGFVPDNIFFISDDAVYLLTARRGQTNAASGAGAQSSRNCFAISPLAVHFKCRRARAVRENFPKATQTAAPAEIERRRRSSAAAFQ